MVQVPVGQHQPRPACSRCSAIRSATPAAASMPGSMITHSPPDRCGDHVAVGLPGPAGKDAMNTQPRVSGRIDGMSEGAAPASFGRVDPDGTVYVRTEAGERSVGQVPDVPAEEALAFFTRRFEPWSSRSPAGDPDRLPARCPPTTPWPRSRPCARRSARRTPSGDLDGLLRPAGRAGARHRRAAGRAEGRARSRQTQEATRGQGAVRRSRPRSSPPATTGAAASTASGRCWTSGRRCPGSTGPPTTSSGTGSPVPGRPTRVGGRPSSPSSPSSGKAPG